MTRISAVEDHHIAFALSLADTARALLHGQTHDALGISVKPDRSLVTQADLMIERELRARIATRYPDHGIIGEEEGSHAPTARAVWVIDPIDGTAPFIAGIPVYGTLIALAIDGVPRLGIIDSAVNDARWLGVEGRQTTLNGRPVQVRSCADISRALMTNSNQDYMSAAELPALEALRRATATRVYGGACINYGRLAEGRTDLAMDAGQKIFDFAAFRPIVEGAGGVITDWAGVPLTLASGGRILGAGDPGVHRQALGIIEKLRLSDTPPELRAS